jgi:hypothetical protein
MGIYPAVDLVIHGIFEVLIVHHELLHNVLDLQLMVPMLLMSTNLERKLTEMGIYPAVDPLASTSRALEPSIVGHIMFLTYN